jgi:hypothetical protein
MSQTLDQIFIANPASSLVSTDLIYLSRSPYTPGHDFGITAANFIASTVSGAVLLAPSGDQTIVNAHNLIMSTGSLIAPTVLPGNLSLSGNTISTTNTNGDMVFIANGLGEYLFGSATEIAPQTAGFEVAQFAQGGYQTSLRVGAFVNSTFSAAHSFFKSRSTTIGSFSEVQNGDTLGLINFNADDGSIFRDVTQIASTVSGTVSPGVVPTNLFMKTTNSSGTLTTALTISNAQVATFAGQVIAPSFAPNTTSGIIGTTTNDSAAAGSVGEFISSTILSGSSLSLPNNTNTDVTSISLTAGDWDLWGNLVFMGNVSTSVNITLGWINSLSATQPNASFTAYNNFGSGSMVFASGNYGFTIPYQRISLSTTTIIYLSVYSFFTVSTQNVFGGIYARRAR